MYSYIQGQLIEKNPTFVIIDVNGIGYQIHISLNTYSKIGDSEKCKLFTHFIVREDAQFLYGFISESERSLFQNLISVNGVGANTARLILSAMSPDEIYNAIVAENARLLQSVKGIGGKTAQRIVIDLKDKLEKVENSSEFGGISHNTKREEALSGLIVLGFNKNVAGKALDNIIKAKGSDISVEDLIKQALKIL